MKPPLAVAPLLKGSLVRVHPPQRIRFAPTAIRKNTPSK